jgi:hypothetical protein
VRLLLDEHISPAVARALRDRGHDVIAVAEHAELRSLADASILVAAASDHRVVVTQDIEDFTRIGSQRLPDGRWHRGVVLASPRSFPPSKRSAGPLIRALELLLTSRHPSEELAGEMIWLDPAPEEPS